MPFLRDLNQVDLRKWYMQSVIPNNRFQDVRTRVLEEIKATQKRIHPLFNLIMQNKVDHANRILPLWTDIKDEPYCDIKRFFAINPYER